MDWMPSLPYSHDEMSPPDFFPNPATLIDESDTQGLPLFDKGSSCMSESSKGTPHDYESNDSDIDGASDSKQGHWSQLLSSSCDQSDSPSEMSTREMPTAYPCETQSNARDIDVNSPSESDRQGYRPQPCSSSGDTTPPPAPGNSKWPLLGKGDQGEGDVQEWVVKTLRAYQKYCAHKPVGGSSSAAFLVEGTPVNVFESAPGYGQDFVKGLVLELEAWKNDKPGKPMINMSHALCIIDCAHTKKGDGVSFSGPADSTLYDKKTFKVQAEEGGMEKEVHAVRVGGQFSVSRRTQKDPHESFPQTQTIHAPGVKPWKFWLGDNRDNIFPSFYLCLYVPFAKDLSAPRTKRRRGAEVEEERRDASELSLDAHGAGSTADALEATARGGGGAEERDERKRRINRGLDGPVEAPQLQQVQPVQHATGQVERCLGKLVEALLERVQASGFLTRGNAQENLFRKSVERSLLSVAEAVGDKRKLSVKWPDYVFQDNYARLTLAECCQHVEKNKHLPLLRPASEVEATGVDVVSDHIRLVEQVENLFLYVRDLDRKNESHESEVPVLDTPSLPRQSRTQVTQSDAQVPAGQSDAQVPADIEASRMRLRKECWDALSADDPAALFAAIDKAVCTFKVTSSELLVLLERWLWKKSAGKGGKEPVGLVAAAATNVAGVPKEGALRCLDELLRRFPDEASRVSGIMQKADDLTARGIDRSRAAALLRIAAEATNSSNTCPPAPPTRDSPTSQTGYLSVLLLNLNVSTCSPRLWFLVPLALALGTVFLQKSVFVSYWNMKK